MSEALRQVVERYRHEPFAWGSHDCALFAARCFDAQLGTDFESRILRLGYHSPIGAIRVLQKEGGWEAFITRLVGEPVAASEIAFGDLVLGHGIDYAGRRVSNLTLVGICDEEYFMAPAQNGLAWIPMAHAMKGWPCRRR